MELFKRLGLFFAMNIAILVLFSVIIFVIELTTGINISAAAGQSYFGLLVYAAIFGFLGAFFSLFISRWSAKRLYGIVPVSPEDISTLSSKERLVYQTVQEISERNNIKMPEVGFYDSQDPNAFATGATKNSSLVAVSSGLLDIMNEREIEGVVAHEMAHILNGDMVTMTLLQGVMNTFIIFFARIVANIINERTDGKLGFIGYNLVYFLLQIVFGILASLILNAFSRYREYRADEGSATYVGKEKMIAALEALQKYQERSLPASDTYAPMKINGREHSGFLALFLSHPSLENRILNLENKQNY